MAFTGNKTAGVEHSTMRMDYRWPSQEAHHQEFFPQQRSEPTEFYKDTTYGKHFQAPPVPMPPAPGLMRDANPETHYDVRSTYQADFTKFQQASHEAFTPQRRSEPTTFSKETTYGHFFANKMPEVQKPMSPLEQTLRQELGELPQGKSYAPTPQGKNWEVYN